jgi:hypothetical protein
MRFSCLTAVLWMLITAAAHGETIHVPPGTIQQAINLAAPGDEVVVAPGVYPECIDFTGKAIILRSSGGPEVTTIDGSGCGNSVVICAGGEGPDTVLEGFTITGGSGNTTLPLDPPPSMRIPVGGGMTIHGSSPTVRRCIFRDNRLGLVAVEAGVGGGIFTYESNARVTDCDFIANEGSNGGGMYNMRSDVCIVRCRFLSNSAGNDGGAIVNHDSSPVVTGCWFIENTTVVNDGGAVRNVRFTSEGSNATYVNCVFSRNTARRHGGAMVNEESDPKIVNCTFLDNEAMATGGALALGFQSGGNVNVRNAIFWRNTPSDVHVHGGTLDMDCSLVGVDPMLDADFCPQEGSPAIDAGCNEALPLDPCDLDNNGDTAETTPLDIHGNTRRLDDPATEDSGLGASPIVDIGACEYRTLELRLVQDDAVACNTARVSVLLTTTVPVEAISFGVCQDPSHVTALEFDAAPVWRDAPPEFLAVNAGATGDANLCPGENGVTVAMLGSKTDPAGAALQPSRDLAIGAIVYQVVAGAPAGGASDLRFCDCLIAAKTSPPTACVVTSRGMTVRVVRKDSARVVIASCPFFKRGDCNSDAAFDISDVVFLLLYLFNGQLLDRPPSCLDACDFNDSGRLDLTDAVYALERLFRGGPLMPAPAFPDCGLDTTPDGLGCDSYPGCAR